RIETSSDDRTGPPSLVRRKKTSFDDSRAANAVSLNTPWSRKHRQAQVSAAQSGFDLVQSWSAATGGYTGHPAREATRLNEPFPFSRLNYLNREGGTVDEVGADEPS